MNQTCIITDDEPIALEILEDYIKMVPGLELIAKCKDAMETWSIMRTNKVDILFIDIKMPGISGIEFVKSLSFRPVIIFTTAYPQYAIDGFDLEVTDYLLKPISFERFLKAVSKAIDKCGMTVSQLRNESDDDIQNKSLFIKSDKGMVKITYREILYIEALENYVTIHTIEKKLISLVTMKNLEELLPPSLFLRIHRSYIVNLKKIGSINGSNVRVEGNNLLIGKSFKKEVMEIFKKNLLF